MKDEYMSEFTYGGAVPAEEYAAALAESAEECGCKQETEISGSNVTERDGAGEGCCCKRSFREAFQLLCDEELSDLLDFGLSAFVTDHYVAGAAVAEAVDDTTPADNLVAPLAGSFLRLSPCSCDLLNISADLFTAPETPTGLTATQVSLCELIAAVIQLAETEAEGELSAEEVAARNFRRVRRILSRQIGSCCCGDQGDCCPCSCDDCCCAAGVRSVLAEGNLSRRVSLAAGPLLLSGVALLGTVGNVLILANDEDLRIYFVCVSEVEFIV